MKKIFVCLTVLFFLAPVCYALDLNELVAQSGKVSLVRVGVRNIHHSGGLTTSFDRLAIMINDTRDAEIAEEINFEFFVKKRLDPAGALNCTIYLRDKDKWLGQTFTRPTNDQLKEFEINPGKFYRKFYATDEQLPYPLNIFSPQDLELVSWINHYHSSGIKIYLKAPMDEKGTPVNKQKFVELMDKIHKWITDRKDT